MAFLRIFAFIVFASGSVHADPPVTEHVAKQDNPQIVDLFEPIIISDVPHGYVFDARDVTFRAMVPMNCVVCIIPPDGRQVFSLRIDLGIIDANGLAANGVRVTRTQDSMIEIGAVLNAVDTGVYVHQSGRFGTFNNLWRIGSIRGGNGNGLVLDSRGTPDLKWGVQGNHFQVGQIIANRDSGVVAFGIGSFANRLVVGPVEENGMFGCYDESWGNQWVIVYAGANGVEGVC